MFSERVKEILLAKKINKLTIKNELNEERLENS